MFAAIVVLLALASCFLYRGDPGPVMLSQTDGQLEIAFCFAGEVRSVRIVQLRPGQDPDDYETVWLAQGPREVEFADIVAVGSSEQGFSSVDFLTEPTLTADSIFQIDVETERDWFSAVITVPEGGLTEGAWVMQRQKVVTVPCEGYDPSS